MSDQAESVPVEVPSGDTVDVNLVPPEGATVNATDTIAGPVLPASASVPGSDLTVEDLLAHAEAGLLEDVKRLLDAARTDIEANLLDQAKHAAQQLVAALGAAWDHILADPQPGDPGQPAADPSSPSGQTDDSSSSSAATDSESGTTTSPGTSPGSSPDPAASEPSSDASSTGSPDAQPTGSASEPTSSGDVVTPPDTVPPAEDLQPVDSAESLGGTAETSWTTPGAGTDPVPGTTPDTTAPDVAAPPAPLPDEEVPGNSTPIEGQVGGEVGVDPQALDVPGDPPSSEQSSTSSDAEASESESSAPATEAGASEPTQEPSTEQADGSGSSDGGEQPA